MVTASLRGARAPRRGLEGQWPDAPPRQKAYNVLKIAPTSFFADYGCHVRIYEESRTLQARGNRVAICTYPSGADVPGLAIYRGIEVPWNRSLQMGSSLHKLYYDALLALKSAQVARRLRPNLIHAHLHEGALIGFWIARRWGVPLVFDFQGSLTSEMVDHNFIARTSLAFRPLRGLEAIINQMADAVITSSQNAAEVLIRDFGYPPAKVVTIPDRVNGEVFRPWWEMPPGERAWRREKLGIPPGRMVIAYLGLLAEYQGVGKLLMAVALLVERGYPVHLLLMGFPGEARYRALAAGLGISDRVTFTGKVSYFQAPYYLALGDVAVSPKLSETEGNGKLLNYMAVGLPTVAFETPVAKEILGPLGIYAAPGDAPDLARALAWLVRVGEEAYVLGQKLRERALTRYSWDGAGDQLEGVYERLTARRESASKPR